MFLTFLVSRKEIKSLSQNEITIPYISLQPAGVKH